MAWKQIEKEIPQRFTYNNLFEELFRPSSEAKMEDATAISDDFFMSQLHLHRGGALVATVCNHLSTICIFFLDLWLEWHMVILSPIVLLFILPGFILILLYGTALFLHIYQHRRRQIYDAYASNFWEGARSSVAAFYDAQATLWHGKFRQYFYETFCSLFLNTVLLISSYMCVGVVTCLEGT